MSYSIAYQKRAINEYEEAATWYGERSIQAAENFEKEVRERLDILRNNPERYKKVYKEFREMKLHKYPFNIIYLIEHKKTQIVISSIYHFKRHPLKKYRNLK